MAKVFGNEDKCIQDLPENIVLEIFTYLQRKDLCRACRVCRSWRRIGKDNSLWRHVDMTPYKLDLHGMWKVVRSHFSDVLLTLKIKGFMTPASNNWKKSSMSDAMLKELKDRCPNLRHLAFYTTNLMEVSANLLPSSLQSLEVISSMMPMRWLQQVSQTNGLPNLRFLSFEKSSKLNNADLAKDICNFKQLKSLSISGCYRISDDGLKAVATSLAHLEYLDISETECKDLVLHLIGRNFPFLETLKLSACKEITDSGVAAMASGLKVLKSLDLSKCKQVKDGTLKHLCNMPKLCKLDICSTEVSPAGIKDLFNAAPQIKVISNFPSTGQTT